MQCKQCDYRLWNLTSRQCPECGTKFAPSDFEYIPSSVAFCCPHCDQAYYGSDANGHLVPNAFECVQCQRDIHMDEMVLRPAEGVSEGQTHVDVCPWLERKKRGLFKAWFSTIGMAMVSPRRLARTLPGETKRDKAWWFALLTTMTCMIVGMSPLFLVVMFAIMSTGGARGPGAGLGVIAGTTLIPFAVSFIAVLIYIVLWGAVTHSVLHLSGRHAHSRLMTYQALCYSTGSFVLTAIPCVGFYIGWIWPIISGVLMVKEAQKVQGWRAALSVLTLPCVLLFGFVLLYGGAIFLVLTNIPTMPTNTAIVGTVSPESEQTSKVLTAVLTYANENDGHGPTHAIQLVEQGYVDAEAFLLDSPKTRLSTIPVGNTDLKRFQELQQDEQTNVVNLIIGAMSDKRTTHRLGHFVFSYHGSKLTLADPAFWVFVVWPHPLSDDVHMDPHEAWSSTDLIWIGQADGTVRSVSPSAFESEMDKQNLLRRTLGMPSLPKLTPETSDKLRAVGGQ